MMQFILVAALSGAGQPQLTDGVLKKKVAASLQSSGHPTLVYIHEVKGTRCFRGYTTIRVNGAWDNKAGIVYKKVLDWRDVPAAELRALERFEFNSLFRNRSHAVQIP